MKLHRDGFLEFEEGEIVHLERVTEGRITKGTDIVRMKSWYEPVWGWDGYDAQGNEAYRLCDTGEAYRVVNVTTAGPLIRFDIRRIA